MDLAQLSLEGPKLLLSNSENCLANYMADNLLFEFEDLFGKERMASAELSLSLAEVYFTNILRTAFWY